jgi:cystathionine beta-lyase/cystathionine gamma-synthase
VLEEKDRIFIAASNPNTNEFVEKYVKWKGQLLVLPCSGMAAVYSTMAAQNSGDHIVSSSSVLSDTFLVHQLFSKVEYSNIVF